jgi:hypothetical protein
MNLNYNLFLKFLKLEYDLVRKTYKRGSYARLVFTDNEFETVCHYMTDHAYVCPHGGGITDKGIQLLTRDSHLIHDFYHGIAET